LTVVGCGLRERRAGARLATLPRRSRAAAACWRRTPPCNINSAAAIERSSGMLLACLLLAPRVHCIAAAAPADSLLRAVFCRRVTRRSDRHRTAPPPLVVPRATAGIHLGQWAGRFPARHGVRRGRHAFVRAPATRATRDTRRATPARAQPRRHTARDAPAWSCPYYRGAAGSMRGGGVAAACCGGSTHACWRRLLSSGSCATSQTRRGGAGVRGAARAAAAAPAPRGAAATGWLERTRRVFGAARSRDCAATRLQRRRRWRCCHRHGASARLRAQDPRRRARHPRAGARRRPDDLRGGCVWRAYRAGRPTPARAPQAPRQAPGCHTLH
jgi:hypothetical protein